MELLKALLCSINGGASANVAIYAGDIWDLVSNRWEAFLKTTVPMPSHPGVPQPRATH